MIRTLLIALILSGCSITPPRQFVPDPEVARSLFARWQALPRERLPGGRVCYGVEAHEDLSTIVFVLERMAE